MRRQDRIATAEFRARCLELMDEVNAGRKEFLVTRRGVPVALMVPADEPSEPPDSIDREAPWPKDWPYPDLRHLVSYLGDVVTPIDLDWEAMR